MLRLVIFVCKLSLVYGYINITSIPAKVANGNPVKLICDVGTMEKTVKWIHEGVTYFSCDPPFTDCLTNSNNINKDYYEFSINENSIIVMIFFERNQSDGIWSCHHGSDNKDFKIDNGDLIKKVLTLEYGGTITCTFESKTPANVLIYAISYNGTRILYKKKQLRPSKIRVTPLPALPCMYHKVYCKVTNGYGVKISYDNIYVECPLKILYDLSPKTTFVLNDTFSSKELKILHFEGYPRPDLNLYRNDANDIYRIYTGDYRPIDLDKNYFILTEPAYVYVKFNDYDEVEAGKYILILRQENITKSFHFNLIYSTNNIDEENTTDVPVDKNKIGLGVAGFVMSLLLVMGLVAVGVFWYIRIKRKPAGSKDKVYSTKDYKTTTPNEIYENME